MTFKNQKWLCVMMTAIAVSMMAVVFQLVRIEAKLTPAAVQQPAPTQKPGFTLQFSGGRQ